MSEITPIEFSRRLNEWIGKWANGEVKDQTGLYLDKLVKQKALENGGAKTAAKPKMTAEDKAKIVQQWVSAFCDHADWARGGPYTEAAAQVDQYAAEAAADALEMERPAPVESAAPAQGASGEIGKVFEEAMGRELEQTSAENERLKVELARAHDWRYNLESRARDAYAAVREVLGSPTAPTKQAVQAILQTLRDGIEWTP